VGADTPGAPTEEGTKVMRQSMIGTGDICHKRLGFDQFLPSKINNRARALGTGFHAILEAEGLQRMRGGTYDMKKVGLSALREAVEIEGADRFEWEGGDFEETLDLAFKMARYYIDNHWWDPSTYKMVAVEESFNIPWITTTETKWWSHGTIDAVYEGLDGYIYLVDYKGSKNKWRKGKEKPRQTPQAAWYLYWFAQWWFQTRGESRKFRFYYDVTTHGTGLAFNRIESSPTPYQTEVILQKATQYALMLDSGGPFLPNTSHFLCDHRWCDHWEICEFGESFNNPSMPPEVAVRFRH